MSSTKPFSTFSDNVAETKTQSEKTQGEKTTFSDVFRGVAENVNPEKIARAGRHAYETVKTTYRDQPSVALATAGGLGLVVGMLFGSKIARTALLVGVGFGIARYFDGEGAPLLKKVREKIDDATS